MRPPPTNIAGYDPTRHTAGCEWDADAAARVLDFFPAVITHPDRSPGAKPGDPFRLERWQQDYLATLYGWRRPDGTRRYQESAFFTPRKNGKTSLFAGVALYEMTAQGRHGAQFYSAATEKEQASLVFRIAAAMVRKSRHLSKMLDVIDSTRRIVFKRTGSYYRAIPSEAASAHGFKPACVFFDELHTQTDNKLLEALETGFGSTVDPLFVAFSTAGWNRHGPCFAMWQRARRVRDTHGADDPYFLPLVYELAEDADWTDEATWHACNPNLGVSISLDFLRKEFKKAVDSSSQENSFRNLYLNQWVEQAVRWLPMKHWDDCGGELPALDGEPCWCGLDLSATTDLTAFVMVFRHDDHFVVLPHFWIPEDTAGRKEREDHVPYRQWAEHGFLTLTPGNQVDHAFVRKWINEAAERYSIQEIGFDSWNATQLSHELIGDGFNLVEMRQGYGTLSGPSKELEKLVLAGKLMHGGNPVLRWNASNVAVQRDVNDNLRPVKDKSTGRIDGIVATIMGLGRAMGATADTYWNPADGVTV